MRIPAATVVVSALLAVGCGSERQPSQSGGQSATLGGSASYSPYQPRDGLLQCLRENGLEAIPIGKDGIQVLPAPDSPRIVVAATADAATARQVRGEAEGAQLMGSALVYANRSSDEQVRQIEDCL